MGTIWKSDFICITEEEFMENGDSIEFNVYLKVINSIIRIN